MSAGVAPVAPPPVQVYVKPVRDVKWVVALIVSILIGFLGVDRFMMGHVGLGLLKLFTLGACGIWSLIDIILIATKYQFSGVNWVD